MRSYITGSKDTDFLLLLNILDSDLDKFFQINRKISLISKMDAFWKQKAMIAFSVSEEILDKLKNFLEFTDYKSFYFYVLPHAEQWQTVFNAYSLIFLKKFDKIKFPSYINKSELIKTWKRLTFRNAYELDIPEHDDDIYNNEYDVISDLLKEFYSCFNTGDFDSPRMMLK